MANNAQEVETQIWQALAECTDADELRHLVFGKDKLLHQYLQLSTNSIDGRTEIINLVFQRLQDLRFDESKDEEFANWKRVRASIEHENTLVNHRLSWLFSSQAFLFTAFALVFNTWKGNSGGSGTGSHFPYLLGIISVVGILICISIQDGLNKAENQLRILDKWWHREWDSNSGQYKSWTNINERNLALKGKSLKHPPLQGDTSPAPWVSWFQSPVIPVLFLMAWALIIVLIVFDLSSPVATFLTKNGLLVLSYVIVAIVVLLIKETVDRSSDRGYRNLD
ncbi:MAG: hypothetical protein QNJ51_12730 [Calothrix sp. MO_167.B12]|nr:hypothetical protein [Calothrix sp. MO_167.B12]